MNETKQEQAMSGFRDGLPDAVSPSSLRVLLVEDCEQDALLLKRALQRGGYEVLSRRVASAAELNDAMRQSAWDLVLLDYCLPGFEASAALATVRAADADLPVILVSGKIGEDAAAGALEAGAQDCIYKSNLARLLPVVERELHQTVLRRESRIASQAVQRVESALRQSEERFLQLAANIPECFWLIDVELRKVVYVNAAYEQIWGRRVDDLYRDRMDWLRHVHPEDYERIADAARRAALGGLNEDFRTLRPDGSVRWLHVRTFPILDEAGAVRSVGGVANDVTSFVDQQQRLTHLAHYDSLTALPNRLLFYERLSGAIAMARRNGWKLGVLFIDLDRFKNVNDTLGHIAGDELLRQVAGRLSGCLRESDTVGRLGGDEFAVILPELEDGQLASVVARKVVDALALPIQLEGEDVFASASIGITLFPDDADDLHTLLRNADTAMYRAKDLGRNNYQFYTAAMNERARERLLLETDLRHAMARQEFVLHYQPKVSCSSGRMVGFEALIRWRHPQRGLVPPSEFIGLLEETGLIVQVGQWVLRTACAQAQAWRQAGLGAPSIAVNLSGRQLQSDLLVDEVVSALEDSGLPASALELELTESVLMHNAELAARTLNRLKAKGVSISVDDFGTGYSSLSYLKRFPLDSVKVDRSFVQDIAADPDDASITRAVITMAHHLKLKVVAEGVETEGQLALLIANRCDQIQGFYFCRPLPTDEVEALLREDRRLPTDLLRVNERRRVVLFVGPQLRALNEQLERDGYRVLLAPDAQEGAALLAAHRVDLVVAQVEAGGVACLRQASELRPAAERILLCDEASWGRIADAFSDGTVQRCFRLPLDEVALRRAVEGVLQSREQIEEGQRLGHETQHANGEVLRLGEALRRTQGENEDLRARGDAALGLLQDFTRYMPWPLIGVDDEGLIAMSNGPADTLFTQHATLLGQVAAEILPAPLPGLLGGDRLGDPAELVELAGRAWRVKLHPLGLQSSASGRLLALIPEELS